MDLTFPECFRLIKNVVECRRLLDNKQMNRQIMLEVQPLLCILVND